MTKQERLEHYKILLDAFENPEKHERVFTACLCGAIDFLIYNGNFGMYKGMSELYPELLISQKPKNALSYWFPKFDYEPRIEALKKAIELCQAK